MDGYLARRWRAVSVTGKALDTFADVAFFLGILGVMLGDSSYSSFAIFYIPGIALGIAALGTRMMKLGRLFTFPSRPIEHVSFILYAAIVAMIYYQNNVFTMIFMIFGAIAILLSAVMLLYRAILSKQ